MPIKMIDLSLTIEPNPSEPVSPRIDYISYAEGADVLGRSHGLTRNDFPEQMGISQEHISLTSHTGTHLDAPSHYGPYCENKPARTIEEVPLEWCYADGVLIKVRSDIDEPVSLVEVITYLHAIDYIVKPFDIVLFHTGAEALWNTKEYFTSFRGISLEVTKWLLEQGVKIIGVDSFGFDPPFSQMLASYRETNNSDVLWPAHIYGRHKEYCQIERLTNLEQLPTPYGFKVCCFPIKIKQAGAGWSRVVAIIEGDS